MLIIDTQTDGRGRPPKFTIGSTPTPEWLYSSLSSRNSSHGIEENLATLHRDAGSTWGIEGRTSASTRTIHGGDYSNPRQLFFSLVIVVRKTRQ